jgi:hypothetical protein
VEALLGGPWYMALVLILVVAAYLASIFTMTMYKPRHRRIPGQHRAPLLATADWP